MEFPQNIHHHNHPRSAVQDNILILYSQITD